MSPLTGEQLVIFPPIESIFEITFALRSLKTAYLQFLVRTDALGMSLLTFEETGVPNVLLTHPTVTNTVITSTVGLAKVLAVISVEDLTEELRTKTTSASTVRQILLSDAVLLRRLQLSIGLVFLNTDTKEHVSYSQIECNNNIAVPGLVKKSNVLISRKVVVILVRNDSSN